MLAGQIGGICERNTWIGGSYKSLNSGILSLKLQGTIQPSAVIHLAFAHEVGHGFGSPVSLNYIFVT